MRPMRWAATLASEKLIGSATTVSRNTPSPAARSSRKSRARPPSKTTMATASPTIGLSPPPNALAGCRICRTGPTRSPKAKRSTMAGKRSRPATHCAPTPPTAMQRTAVATACDMNFLGRTYESSNAAPAHFAAGPELRTLHFLYRIIGDVHGHADELRALLKTLGYVERTGAYRQPSNVALFLGNLIDRGLQQLDCVRRRGGDRAGR